MPNYVPPHLTLFLVYTFKGLVWKLHWHKVFRILGFPIINKSEIRVRVRAVEIEICLQFIANLFTYSDALDIH